MVHAVKICQRANDNTEDAQMQMLIVGLRSSALISRHKAAVRSVYAKEARKHKSLRAQTILLLFSFQSCDADGRKRLMPMLQGPKCEQQA